MSEEDTQKIATPEVVVVPKQRASDAHVGDYIIDIKPREAAPKECQGVKAEDLHCHKNTTGARNGARRRIPVVDCSETAESRPQIELPEKPAEVADNTEVAKNNEQILEKAYRSTKRSFNARRQRRKRWPKVSFGQVVMALCCAGVLVFSISYFVQANSTDFSVQVEALKTGVDATYPSYIPRGYSLSDITSEDGKITLSFKDASTGNAFTLTEEKSSWDSNALFSNYVASSFGDNYTTLKEQGLTIYISSSDAAWVNKGVVYKIDTTSGSLTKKQLRSIAVST